MLVQRPESLSATLTRTAKIPPGMMLAIAIQFRNSRDRRRRMPGTEAPSVLRMPISLVLCATEKDARPKMPRQEMRTAIRAQVEKIVPIFLSSP